jgi:hypothetical protein
MCSNGFVGAVIGGFEAAGGTLVQHGLDGRIGQMTDCKRWSRPESDKIQAEIRRRWTG